MPTVEKLSIALPAEMASIVRNAVDGGEYSTNSEVIREALRDWKVKRELRLGQLSELKLDIDRGLADVAEGRVAPFDVKRVIARGRELLEDRSISASPKQRS